MQKRLSTSSPCIVYTLFMISLFTAFCVTSTASEAAEQKPFLVPLVSYKVDKQLTIYPKVDGWLKFKMAFSSDGSILATANQDTLDVWDARTGKRIFGQKLKSIESVALSPDGMLVAAVIDYRPRNGGSNENDVHLWNVVKGEKVRTISAGRYARIFAAALNNDGNTIALCGWPELGEFQVVLRSISSGWKSKELHGHTKDSMCQSIAFSPDGAVLVTGGMRQLILWNWKEEKAIAKYGKDVLGNFTFSKDSAYVGWRSGSNYFSLLDVKKGHIRSVQYGGDMSISADGKYLLAQTVLYEIGKDDIKKRQIGGMSGIDETIYSPDGVHIAAGYYDGRVVIMRPSISEEMGAVVGEVARYDAEVNAKKAKLYPPRDQYETTDEYNARMEKARTTEAELDREAARKVETAKKKLFPYSGVVYLGDYNADGGGFHFSTHSHNRWEWFVQVPRERARELAGRTEAMQIEGSIRYHDAETAELVNAFIVAPTGEKYAFGVKTEATAVASAPAAPPALKITSLLLLEPSGNNVLDAEEKGRLEITVKNTGRGTATGVDAVLKTDVQGISVAERTVIGTLEPGVEQKVSIPVAASTAIKSGKVALTAVAAEAGGFDSAPVILSFSTAELVQPLLEIARVELKDSEGKRVLTKGVETEVTLTVRNSGAGPARGVAVEVKSTDKDIHIFGERRASIGNLPPQGSGKAVFTMAVTRRYAGAAVLPLEFVIHEERERFSAKPVVALTLNEEAPEIRVVNAKAVAVPAAAATVDDINVVPAFMARPRENDLAVVIGVENYQNVQTRSDFSYQDAKLVREYLKAMGFREKNIEYLVNEKATGSTIRKAVETWLPNLAKKDSRVFIYYSGHGAPDVKGNGYLVPYDGDPNYLADTGYPTDRLYASLAKLDASEIIVMIDACFSGAGGRSVLPKGARPLTLKVKSPVLPSDRMVILTSSQMNQMSTAYHEKEHGLLTYYFLSALKAGNKDLASVFNFAKPRVEDEAKRMNIEQTPTLMPDAGQIKGKYILLQ